MVISKRELLGILATLPENSESCETVSLPLEIESNERWQVNGKNQAHLEYGSEIHRAIYAAK